MSFSDVLLIMSVFGIALILITVSRWSRTAQRVTTWTVGAALIAGLIAVLQRRSPRELWEKKEE